MRFKDYLNKPFQDPVFIHHFKITSVDHLMRVEFLRNDDDWHLKTLRLLMLYAFEGIYGPELSVFYDRKFNEEYWAAQPRSRLEMRERAMLFGRTSPILKMFHGNKDETIEMHRKIMSDDNFKKHITERLKKAITEINHVAKIEYDGKQDEARGGDIWF